MYPFNCLKPKQLRENFSHGYILQAICFAADKHQNQRRKNASRTPYINHPLQVAQVLWQIGSVHKNKILIAAILHDILEDTDTQAYEIQNLFGKKITKIVQEVSDDTRLSSSIRKAQQIKKATSLSKAAQQIKLADKICNIQDIASQTESPTGWDLARKQAYLCWATQVVNKIKTCNSALAEHYDQVLTQSCQQLQIPKEHLCSTPSLAKIAKTV